MKRVLTIGSLFSGIGGLELGLEWAGLGPTLWQVERDPRCRAVLARNWPRAERFADVRAVGAANLSPVGVLCGGFPCQDVSVAGRGDGLSGARSGLWREFARLVDETQPAVVVVENVVGLVRRGLDVVVGDLDALGYAVEGTRLGADDVGAPHRRKRLFIVAHTHGEGQLRERGPWHEGRGRPGHGSRPADAWAIEPDVGRMAHGIPDRSHRLRMLGNAVVPQCAYIVGMRVRQLAGLV